VPFYPDDPPRQRAQRPHSRSVGNRALRSQPPAGPAAKATWPRPGARKTDRPARQDWNEAAGSGRFELETQPEMPSAPPPEPEAAERSPQAPKGYVVLAIGMPGSGKTTWFRRRGVTPLSSDLLRNILF
jgi:hypothetical protein